MVAARRAERGIVGDQAGLALAYDGRLHAAQEELGGRAADRREGADVAAEHGLQIPGGAEPAPERARVPKHQREQPGLPDSSGLVGERDLDCREAALRLAARGRLGLSVMSMRA